MQSRIHTIFLSLLKAGLWECEVSDIRLFPLENQQWKDLFALAQAQTVEGLIFDGILSLPEIYWPSVDIRMKWLVRLDAIERQNATINALSAKLSAAFEQLNISVQLLKGTAVGQYYAKPHQRVSGDIDLYFENKQDFALANQAISAKGISLCPGAQGSRSYAVGHCAIEHHIQLLDINNPLVQKYVQKLALEQGPKKVYVPLDKGYIYTVSPLMTHVQLTAHILKHYLGFGIGLRQFCDLARFTHAMANQIDAIQLKAVYKNLGISAWMDLLSGFMVDHLGLDAQQLPYLPQKNYSSNWLLADVLSNGNFGFYQGSVALQSKGKSSGKKSIATFLTRAFPHIYRSARFAPGEALAYPFHKTYSFFAQNSRYAYSSKS